MIFCTGLSVPEGPVLLPDESWLVVEMGEERGCVTHISKDGADMRVVGRTGRPNGLAVDADGALWVAESLHPALIRMSMDGRSEVFSTGSVEEPFLFPNDLAFGPDGALYMTDSGIHILDWAPGNRVRPDYAAVATDGRLYRIDTHTGDVHKLDAGMGFTNGICFGPDDDLYINQTLTGAVDRYSWQGGAVSGPRTTFGNVIAPGPSGVLRGPDGMKFGLDGNLYVTVFGQGDVTVLTPEGAVLKRIRTEGRSPTNVAFGPVGSRRIYVTEDERGTLEAFDVGGDGLPLYTGA